MGRPSVTSCHFEPRRHRYDSYHPTVELSSQIVVETWETFSVNLMSSVTREGDCDKCHILQHVYIFMVAIVFVTVGKVVKSFVMWIE